jgi:hypothetical protein
MTRPPQSHPQACGESSIARRSLVLATLLAPIARARAQSQRDLTPSEQALVDRAAAVLGDILDKFRSDDWVEKIEYSYDGASAPVEPRAPLQVGLLRRSYHVRQGSARWNQRIAPLMPPMPADGQMTPAAMQAMVRARDKFRPLMDLWVEASFNETVSSRIAPPPPGNSDLHLAGVARAYRTADADGKPDRGAVLLFGDWGRARWEAEHGAWRYAFVHPPGAVVIENVQVHIEGAADRIEELLRGIDWRAVDALIGH